MQIFWQHSIYNARFRQLLQIPGPFFIFDGKFAKTDENVHDKMRCLASISGLHWFT